MSKTALLKGILAGYLICALSPSLFAETQEILDLSGIWRFQLDPGDKGVEEAWFSLELPDTVTLPGSLNENGIGDPVTVDTPWTGTLTSRMWHDAPRFAPYRDPENTKILFWLQPDKHYIGPAWYQRDIEIPESFHDRHISLILERCHWETRVWVDQDSQGMQNSLVIPHAYDLSACLTPGKHTLTVRVDNTVKINVGVNAHSVSDNTQTNWNGIAGRICLEARDPVYVSSVKAYPDLQAEQARMVVEIVNTTGDKVMGSLTLIAHGPGGDCDPSTVPLSFEQAVEKIEIPYSLRGNLREWSEHDPACYGLEVVLRAEAGEREFKDEYHTVFGMRELGTRGTQLTLNGELIFLRGTLECAIFPKTGYPPTDLDSWRKIITAAKEHGLNHLRFHSWCPPEAAFTVADEMGFMLHVEGPFWTAVGDGAPVDAFIYEECDRILDRYGNHPSFCFLAYGNEPSGRKHETFLGELVSYWKKKDPRRLYTSAAGWPMLENNDYHVTYKPRVHASDPKGMRFRVSPFNSCSDYRDFVAQWKAPVISHEIGQWCVFPNLAEIPKYTGPLKPRNFEIVRDMLDSQGMLDLADLFLSASGKLQTLCYKEEIEAALRTPGFGGFQLLDLHDFPGQGTALVGVLDPFWESKGYVTAQEFHQFCGPTVPLMRMPSCIYVTGDTFKGEAEVTHYGAATLSGITPTWSLRDISGNTLRSGALEVKDIPRGTAQPLGIVTFDFQDLPAPAKMRLFLQVGDHENGWDLWIYPNTKAAALPPTIHQASRLDDATMEALENGDSLLLTPETGSVAPSAFGPVPAAFPPIFWNTFWFPSQELRTLGIWCDPAHPLFNQFPTEFHSNWQWWDLTTHAQVLTLDPLPKAMRPLVGIVDDWNTCRRLGLVFECAVGKGRLLVCGIDINNDLGSRPVARQFRQSLLAYMASDAFAPKTTLTKDELKPLFQPPRLLASVKVRVTASSDQPGFEAGRAADGNPDTFWHSRWEGGEVAAHPHWIRMEFEEPVRLSGLKIIQRKDMTNGRIGRYQVYMGNGLNSRGKMVAHGELEDRTDPQMIYFKETQSGTFLLLRVLKPLYEGQPWTSLAELDPIPAQ